MSAAYQAGRKAGHLFLSPSLNPFADGTGYSDEWARGWREAAAEEVAKREAERRVRNGFMGASGCSGMGT